MSLNTFDILKGDHYNKIMYYYAILPYCRKSVEISVEKYPKNPQKSTVKLRFYGYYTAKTGKSKA